MQCSRCGTDNRTQARFCHECGQRLPVADQPAKQANRRTLWLAGLGVMACLVLAVCVFGGWLVWQKYGERLADLPVAEQPLADEGVNQAEAPTAPTPQESEPPEARDVPTEPTGASASGYLEPVGPPFTMPNVPISKENIGALAPISFLGHEKVVVVKYSPDGRWLAVAGDSGITVHDTKTLAQIFALPIRAAIPPTNLGFSHVSFSHDGSLLFASNPRSGIGHPPSHAGLWQIPGGAPISLGPSDALATFDPVRPLMAVAYSNNKIDIQNWETGESVLSLTAAGDVSQLLYSPDGRYLAAVSEAGVQVWNTEDWELIATLSEGEPPWDMAFSPDGRFLAEVKEKRDENKILLWELSTPRFVTLAEDDFDPFSIIFTPDGQSLISAGYYNDEEGVAIKVWSVESRSVIQSYEAESKRGWLSIDLNPTMSEIVVSNVDYWGAVKFFDAGSLQPTRGLAGFGDSASNDSRLTYSPDGTKAALVSFTTVSVWDATSMRPLWSHPDHMATVSFSPDSRFIAVGGYRSTSPGYGVESLGGALKIYDATTGDLVQEHHVEESEYGSESVPALAYSPDGRWLALTVSTVDGGAGFWLDTETQQFTPDVLRLSSDYGWNFAWQPAGRLIAAEAGENVVLIDSETKQVVKTLEGLGNGDGGLAFSPDGRLLAVGGGRIVKLWDIEEGWELPGLEVEYRPEEMPSRYSVNYIAFSPDGKLLAATAEGGHVWDSETGEQLFYISEKHDESFDYVSFSPNGAQLIINSEIWGIKQ